MIIERLWGRKMFVLSGEGFSSGENASSTFNVSSSKVRFRGPQVGQGLSCVFMKDTLKISCEVDYLPENRPKSAR